MSLIDFILNLAALLLWVTWRSIGFSPARLHPGLSLLSTLQRADPVPQGRWVYLGLVLLLVGLRSLLYWQLGSAAHWTPGLSMGAVSLPFRSDYWSRMLIFSVLSFGVTLAHFYLWLVLLALLHSGLTDQDPTHRLVRLHLGVVGRWPVWVLVFAPFGLGFVGWLVTAPVYVRLGLMPAPGLPAHGLEQAVVIGLAAYLSWFPLVALVCLLHLLNSYVYLGNSPAWSYIHLTAQKLLWVFRWLPLRIGRLDLAPVLAMVAAVAGTEFACRGLTRLFRQLPW